jgi:hypothetical protein
MCRHTYVVCVRDSWDLFQTLPLIAHTSVGRVYLFKGSYWHRRLCTDLQLRLNLCDDVSFKFLNKSDYMFRWQFQASQTEVIILLTQIASLFKETSETHRYTGRFIMLSVITNIYNKKIKGPTLMELYTATGKLKKFFFWQLEMFDACTTGDTARIDTIFKFLPHTRQHGCIDILHCCSDPCLARIIEVTIIMG